MTFPMKFSLGLLPGLTFMRAGPGLSFSLPYPQSPAQGPAQVGAQEIAVE